jgi:hypothetical protein
MQIEQRHWSPDGGWSAPPDGIADAAQLVLVFGARGVMADAERLNDVRRAYPRATLFGCSTAGEIRGTTVADGSLVSTAVRFERSRLRSASVALSESVDSFEAGRRLAEALVAPELVHVLVLSDGLRVNGSELVKGLARHLPPGVTATGGLSGDGARFERTIVALGDAASEGLIAGIGLYGTGLRVGYGSLGGWDPYGPERRITRSRDNVLFELDGQPALELYKRYLGDYAAGLPATGLLFPLAVRAAERPIVRTILAVDESRGSLTFAGDVPQGATARLMKANFERLIDGATGAARACVQALPGCAATLAILISCVGRKLVLKQRIEEEVEGVRDALGGAPVLTGFYSYGEISPFTPAATCELHNQTMTVTALSEA